MIRAGFKALGFGIMAVAAQAAGLVDSMPDPALWPAPTPEGDALPAPASSAAGSTAVPVVLAGQQSFSDSELRAALSRPLRSLANRPLSEADAYDAAFFVESFYRKQGFPFVSVAFRVLGNRIHLAIREGRRSLVGTVEFIGNERFDDAKLMEYILGPTRERFPKKRDESDLPFVESEISAGVGLVRRLYAADGFLDAVIDDPQIRYSADLGRASIRVRIREGRQYQFGRVTFSGDIVLERAALEAAVAKFLAAPFTESQLDDARRALADLHRERGHFLAEVEALGSRATAVGRVVPVTFRIKAGPVYRFNGISVTGLDQVTPRFMEKRFEPLTGDIYNPTVLDKKFRELIQTGLFDDLKIEPVPIEGDRLRLDVTADEADPKETSFGLGFGSYEGGFASFGYLDRNLFGSGRSFRVDTEFSFRGFKGEVIYTDPWWMDSDFSLNVRAFAQRRELDGYDKFEHGFHPVISRRINEHWEISAFILARKVSIEESEIDPPELLGPSSYWLTSAGITQKFDFRNNAVLPTRGFYGALSLDAGTGDVSFVRGTGQISWYIPITRRSHLALGARAGAISSGGTGLPIDERFFNGGSSTVRSFAERELGPTDRRGHPIGGEAFTVFNAEYTFPLKGDLHGAVFADAGNVISRAGDFAFDDMRYALGVGVRYNLPVGAIRLDLGLNPSPRRHEHSGALHFSIGVAF